MEAPKVDWRKEAAAEYVDRRAALVRDQTQAVRALERARAKVDALTVELDDLDKSARVFGLDVIEAYEPVHTDDEDDGAIPEDGTTGPLIRDIILDALRNAYPEPLRVSQLKPLAERVIGRPVHFKTPGMTLYRLSKDGLVTRDGRDWYFKPSEQQQKPLFDVRANPMSVYDAGKF
jgi:hypothetical protein